MSGVKCDPGATSIDHALVTINTLVSNKHGLPVFQDSIVNSKKCIPIQSLVLIVENWVNTDIIPTTQNLLTLFGCVQVAIGELINKVDLKRDSGPNRFRYAAKASKRERNAGCEGMDEIETPQKYGLKGISAKNTPHNNEPRQNHHPTAKAQKQMRSLCQMNQTT